MNESPTHAALQRLALIDDVLPCGGRPLPELLAEHAMTTPLYIYDSAAIAQRVAALRQAMPPDLSIHYAVKANPMPALLDFIRILVDGMDVASSGELSRVLECGMPAERVSFAGPGKRDAELRSAIACGATLNIESALELERTLDIAERLGLTPRVAVRVNPDFELRSAGMRMGGGPRPFGIDAEQVPGILRRIGASAAHFRGLHIYSGSQNLHADRLIEAQAASFALALRLAEAAPAPLESLNIGGGFGVPYFPGDQDLQLGPIGAALAEQMLRCRQRLGTVDIVLELGRYLVAEAGVYVCRVIDRKLSRGTQFLVTDGGLHHHLAASGNFGQIIRKNYPVVNVQHVRAGPREKLSIVGPLCTPLDILADGIEIGAAQVGDLIAVLQSGAYGYSASPQLFLGHPAPGELLV